MDEEKNINEQPEESPPANEQAAEGQEVDVAEAVEDAPASDDLLSEENAPDSDDNADVAQGAENGSGDPEMLSQDAIDDALQGYSQDDKADLDGTGMSQGDDPVVRHADFQQLSNATEGMSSRNIDLLMDVDLPVSIELGKTRMNVSDILSLGPGSVVELDKLVGEPVDLLVNSKCVARGEVVVVDENFGLRITQLVSPEERIKNLQ